MSGSNADVKTAFWKAEEKPDGYTKKHGYLKRGIRDKVVKEGDTVTYYLWDNPIAVLENGILTLSDCGWRTVTTKDRLNGILRENKGLDGFYVEQERHVWYLVNVVYEGDERASRRFRWDSGVTIALDDPFKYLDEIKPEAIHKKANKMTDFINKFLDNMRRRIDKGTLATGGGECWGILMGIQECDTCENLSLPSCGGGIRFIIKALEEKGYRFPAIFLCKKNEEGEVVPSLEKMKDNWDVIKRALRDFVRKRLIKREHEKANRC